MLVINDLSKKFGNFRALKRVNITAKQGEIFGLVGSNGCGKTTLLKHIMKIYKADEGDILYDGKSIISEDEINEDFYYVQDNIYFSNRITLKNLYNYEKLFYSKISREKYVKLLQYFNIDEDKTLNNMSKGQRKQAAFVMAIVSQAKILLLDEIVDGLDAVIKRKFWNILIEEILERDFTVIISSHDLNELDNICNRIAIMHEGEIIREDDLESLKKEVKRIQFHIEKSYEYIENDDFSIEKIFKLGSVYIATVRGDTRSFIEDLHARYDVMICDELSMNLEEIFISELGNRGYGSEKFEGYASRNSEQNFEDDSEQRGYDHNTYNTAVKPSGNEE